MRKTDRFRELLASQQLEFLLEAHNGISARVAEEAGFPGIWASGLCLSASQPGIYQRGGEGGGGGGSRRRVARPSST